MSIYITFIHPVQCAPIRVWLRHREGRLRGRKRETFKNTFVDTYTPISMSFS